MIPQTYPKCTQTYKDALAFGKSVRVQTHAQKTRRMTHTKLLPVVSREHEGKPEAKEGPSSTLSKQGKVRRQFALGPTGRVFHLLCSGRSGVTAYPTVYSGPSKTRPRMRLYFGVMCDSKGIARGAWGLCIVIVRDTSAIKACTSLSPSDASDHS